MEVLKTNVIDLFAGCGGLSLGFIKAGYTVKKAVEIDASIANTYRLNHPEVEVVVDDIRNIDQAGLFKPGDAEVIIGGPMPGIFHGGGKNPERIHRRSQKLPV